LRRRRPQRHREKRNCTVAPVAAASPKRHWGERVMGSASSWKSFREDSAGRQDEAFLKT